MRIALLGAPGAGKGVQAGHLAGRYGILQVTPVELMREAIAAGSALGQLARAALDASQPVPDEIFLALIRDRLSRPDVDKGFILDGYPRTQAQAEALDAALLQLGKSLQLVLLIDVDLDLLMQRLSGRRSCPSCGWTCNVYSAPPRVDGVCDECGGNLRHRADDNEDTIGNRFRVYETQAAPVNRYYRIKGVLREVDGGGDIGEVSAAVGAAMEAALPEMAPDEAGAEVAVAPARAVAGKKAAAKEKAVAKALATGKAAAKKQTTKKTAAVKKAGVRKAAAKKVVAKKTATKKLVTKKVTTKKVTTKKAMKTTAGKAAGKPATKKAAVAQRPSRPKTAKKPVVKKTAKKPVKKVVPKSKIPAKKKAVGKAVTKKKVVARPTVKKKAAAKKAKKDKTEKRAAKKALKKKARRR